MQAWFTCERTLVKFTHTVNADRLSSEAKRWSDVMQPQHKREAAVTVRHYSGHLVQFHKSSVKVNLKLMKV